VSGDGASLALGAAAPPPFCTGMVRGLFSPLRGTRRFSTPARRSACALSMLASSGRAKVREKLPWLRSHRYHVSASSTFSTLRSPDSVTRLPETRMETSCSLNPGRSAVTT